MKAFDIRQAIVKSLTKAEIGYLVYVINNGLDNIGTRDEYSSLDKKALKFGAELVEILGYKPRK